MIELQDVSLQRGDFRLSQLSMKTSGAGLTLLTGETGSGKSSILECVCGLWPIQTGAICIDQRNVTDLPPGPRNIGYKPQDVALMDHLTVWENLALPLRFVASGRRSEREIRIRVAEISASLSLDDLLKLRPGQLSGGQKQCVAIARAFVFGPQVVILDEPMVGLDVGLRQKVVDWLQEQMQTTDVPVLVSTHQPQHLKHLAKTRWCLGEDGSVTSQV